MATVWRIHLKKDIPTSPDYGEYCLKNEIAAMGWILEKHNPDIASGKISIDSFADFEACAKAEGMDCNQIRRLAEEVKAGDFIWTYVGGKYYLAQVAADSRYRYNADDEAVAYRACNQLTNIDWKCVGTRKDVDEKIAKSMEGYQTLRRLFALDNSDFAFGLEYTREVFKKLSWFKGEFDMEKTSSRDSFPLFRRESNFSDDTVTTIAVANAILKSGNEEDGRIFFKTLVETLQAWCQKYPRRGYGGNFRRWIVDKNPKPYNSYGNGAAMRVSAAGWFCDNIYDTRECARTTARITHNHKEGVKGAMATACAIFLARTGKSKDEIKNYIACEFGYDLDRTIDDIRVHYHHVEEIWKTVPEAIIAFLESTDFESAIRNTVWLGGDVDTVGAITGSIAEAFYGVPDNLIAECRKRLPKEMLDVVDRFNEKVFVKKN